MTKPKTSEQIALEKERHRRYNEKPETLAKRKAYYQRPEVKQRYKERHQTEEHKQYQIEYRQRETSKALARDYAAQLRGFAPGMFKALLELQKNACAVCQRPFVGTGARGPHADHCHGTKEPRGVLCHHCNHAEGNIRQTGLDPEEFARRLKHYLSNPPASYVELA